jgi:hypothetical protein
MEPKICKFCKKDRSAERLHSCHKAKIHDCKVDGHRAKPNCITIFACMYCDYIGEMASELIPSEAELCVGQGIDYSRNYEGDD